MEVSGLPSSLSLFPNSNGANELSCKFINDFDLKLNVKEDEDEGEEEEEYRDCNSESNEEENEFEFSFSTVQLDKSLITAEEAFQNGQIRPLFDGLFIFNSQNETNSVTDDDRTPFSLQPPLKNLLVEKNDSTSSTRSESEGPCCEWSPRTVEGMSPKKCKKSNSTGFSKLRRIRDLVTRSNSEGKDTFVFLNDDRHREASTAAGKKIEKAVAEVRLKKKKGKGETAASVHEKHYVRNRAVREEDKRRSYLPYRRDLVGFFTNVNGLSRNVHPF